MDKYRFDNQENIHKRKSRDISWKEHYFTGEKKKDLNCDSYRNY